MPKSQYVDPGKAFEAGYIHFEDIPVCQYNKTLKEELKIYSKEDMIRIYRDMAIIREFETMLNDVKTKSNYNGVEYNNPGPAHLSIGQEASAVGEAYCLDTQVAVFFVSAAVVSFLPLPLFPRMRLVLPVGEQSYQAHPQKKVTRI